MATVTVGCKIPNGIVLRLSKKILNEKKEVINSDTIAEVLLVGSNGNVPRGADGNPVSIFVGTIGQFGYTEVDEDFWNAWKKDHASWFKPFTTGAIFVSETGEKSKELKAQGADHPGNSGLEAISVNNKTGEIKDERIKTDLPVEGDPEHLASIRRGAFNARNAGVG